MSQPKLIDKLNRMQRVLLDHLAANMRVDLAPEESQDERRAVLAIARLYERFGLKAPVVIWCDGPFQLSVMPILLQLLLDRPNEAAFRRIQRKFGYDNTEDFAAQLSQCINIAAWQTALKQLLAQSSDQTIFSLAFDAEQKLGVLEDQYRLFGWSKCGVPVMDLVWTAVRSATNEAIRALGNAATLTLATTLTNRLYTVPNDQSHSVKSTAGHVIDRELAVRLRDQPSTIFGSAHASLLGAYRRAGELHQQVDGTVFADLLQSYPAPKADPRFATGVRNLPDDSTVNTAGLFAFGPYQTLWGAWASFATTCYSGVAKLIPGAVDPQVTALLSDMSTLLRSGFAYTALTRVVFICRFPESVCVNANNRLHNDLGPALVFPDGYRIYALDGVRCPAEYVESPEQLTGRKIELEPNVELRRVLIDRFGMARYLRETGAAIVDRSERGILYRKQQPGDESIMIVQVRNSTPEADGTFKEYFLRVPPTVQSVQEAVAWTFGLPADEYGPQIET